jgi:hypothetical protein
MGLKVSGNGAGKYITVFDNANILVLDQNLKRLGIYQGAEQDTSLTIAESLYLRSDKNRAPVGSLVSLHGGGYAVNEDLEIDFAKQVYNVKADKDGKFIITIQVPYVSAGGYDFTVIGKSSGLKYNLGFQIE